MGREIRMVPPNWEHPKDDRGNMRPMYDQTFDQAAQEWKDRFSAWGRGKREEYFDANKYPADYQYWEWGGLPPVDREYYRPWQEAEATWYQLWENVTEGTPVTPPFATREELASYLAEHGTFWDDKPWGRERAEAFVRAGAAPSFAFIGGVGLKSEDIPLFCEEEAEDGNTTAGERGRAEDR